MTICHIVAMAENRVIGREGDMPWHLPNELKAFKAATMGHCLVMGRKTFASIGRPLPGRLNVVVTRNPEFKAAGVVTCGNLEEAFSICQDAIDKGRFGPDVFVIGGGQIYQETMDQADRILLTTIHREIDGDTVYPAFDKSLYEVVSEDTYQDPEPYTTQVLVRKK